MATLLKLNPPGAEVAKGMEENAIPEDGMIVLTLNDNGWISSCNKAAGKLLGCATSQLNWQHISMFLPQLAQTSLMLDGKINPRLRFLSRIGHRFEVVSPSGTHFFSRLFFNDLEKPGRHSLCLIIRPIEEESQPH